MYKDYRKNAGLSIEKAAFRLHVAPRTLSKYESGEIRPAPQAVLAMAEAYHAPTIIFLYCRKECPIGEAYNYEHLNQVDLSPQNIILKLYQKYREGGRALEKLMGIGVNKKDLKDFTQDQMEDLKNCLHSLMDLEHTIQVLKMELARRHWIDLYQLVSQHNAKCFSRGYVAEDKVKEGGREYRVTFSRVRKSKNYIMDKPFKGWQVEGRSSGRKIEGGNGKSSLGKLLYLA